MNLYSLKYYVLGEVVSCIFSFILCINIILNFSIAERRQRLFLYGGIGSFFITLFNIFSIICITYFESLPLWFCTLVSTIFFASMVFVPLVLADYAASALFAFEPKKGEVYYSIFGILYALYLIIVLLNVKFGWIFYYDPVKGYTHGPIWQFAYVFLMFYVVITIANVTIHKKNIATRLFISFFSYPLVSTGILAIQFFQPKVILTGTAAFASMLLAYISIQSDLLDVELSTGLMTEKKLRTHMESKSFEGYFYMITIENLSVIQNYMDAVDFNRLLQVIAREFTSRFKRKCYHPVSNRFSALSTNLEQTKEYAEQILKVLRSSKLMEELNLPAQLEVYSVIIGCAKGEKSYGVGVETANNMIQNAIMTSDSRIKVCDESVLVNLERKRLIYKILKRELNEDSQQFQVWFQPIYSIKENRFTYMEALSRLKGTEIGDIPPQEFVEVAERRGLIETLGFVAFEKACKFMAENKDLVDAVSINFSVYQMSNDDVVEKVLNTISRFNLTTSNIIMEITESIFIDNYQQVLRNMKELSAAGMQFYLDDFGTGYSNLANVIGLPFRTIKLDRSLVLMMEEKQESQRLFMNLVSTFKDADLKILVEGVETQNQNYLVTKAGADYIQGFLYSRPLPAEECVELFRRQNIT